MTATALDTAIAAIRRHGTMRTPELAGLLGVGEGAVDAMLDAARADGRLITCAVELAGGRHVTEYRCSTAGNAIAARSHRIYRPSAALRVKTESTHGTEPSRACDAVLKPQPQAIDIDAIHHRREEQQVNLIERAQALFKKHGPMTARQVRGHDAAVGDHLKELCDGAHIGRLGGKTSGVIYGLPDQSAADARPQSKDAPPRSIHKRRAKKKRTKVAKRRGARTAFKAPVKPASKAFRPALAADGAILLLGAKKGDFEIDRSQARTLLHLVRRLEPKEAAALVGFIACLDGAEVAA